MRIVFFGTPYYVIPVLEALHKNFKSKKGESPIVAVVTQKPKPVGRKKILEYSPVDTWAYKRNVPIFFDAEEIVKNYFQADIGVIASYGTLLPKSLVNYFPHGILVIHPSLLPQFRLSSPVPATIITNTNPTGVTIIKMDEKFDHGPIVNQFREEVKQDDTYVSLRDRLFAKSADEVVQLLPAYIQGKINLQSQDDSQASFARMLTKEDAFIPPKYFTTALKGTSLKGKWQIPFIKPKYEMQVNPENVERFIRAMYPWPGAWTLLHQGFRGQVKRLKILKAHLTQPTTHNLLLIPDLVQLEGKNPVSWKQFLEAYPKAIFKNS